MAVFKKMFKKFLGFEDEVDEELTYEEFEETEDLNFESNVNIRENVIPKDITLFPKTFGDACEVVEQIELGNIVTVDMEDVDIDTCKRISDFVLGAIYALEGDVEKLSKKVFRFWTRK